MKFTKAIFFAYLILLSSCNKDDDVTNSSEQEQEQQLNHDASAFAENFGNTISRTFIGNVIDTNYNPIVGVLIKIGNQEAMTDSNGVFIIQDALVKERFGYITAEKSGYIHASRAVVPNEGTNKVTIMMLPETVVGSTLSGTQEIVELANGTAVSFEGDYIKEDGTPYSGNINVIMHHLNPTDENMNAQMPGMLYAANEQNEERMLQTFGMLAVELRGDNGEDLNITEGSSAEIRVPLDASLLADAPSTIPLWYFDEVNGYWIEEGQATLVGNAYVGTVTHFSFWSFCSIIHIEKSILSIYVKDENQNPLENLKVSLQIENFNQSSGYTNEYGVVTGFIPSNQIINMNVFDNFSCEGNAIYSESVGPFSENTSLNITISNNPISISEEIEGTFDTCNGSTINNGYIFITHSGKVFTSTVQNGNFNTNILRCSENDTFQIEAIDYETYNTTGEINYTFNTPYTYLGDLSSCNDIQEFIQFTIDGIPKIITDNINCYFDAQYTADWSLLLISANWNTTTEECISISGGVSYNPPYEGTYDEFYFPTSNNSNNCQEVSNPNDPDYNILVFVTLIGEVGEYVDLNFNGTYSDSSGNPHSINGVAHILRDE